jgi:hypothetical protein
VNYFRTYHSYLKELFSCRVYKVTIDGGFSCPNRDGSKGFGGCIFCDETGSSSQVHIAKSIQYQVVENIIIRKTRYQAKKFIVYFQSFSNTYAPVDILKERYDAAVYAHEDIVGLSIATRPDCIDLQKLEMIASYKNKLPYVNIEFGLQTIHNKTLNLINRKESHEDFLKALELSRKVGLEPSVHVILGLPGETKKEMLETAKELAKLNIFGIKIHMLIAMENTPLAIMYEKKLWNPLTFEEYVDTVCDFLEILPPACVIHRLSGNGHPLHQVTSDWVYTRKKEVIEAIHQEFEKRKTYQGFFF